MRCLLVALALSTACCGPMNCQTFAIDVYAHPSKPKPAGKVAMKCNGKTVIEALADDVEGGK